MRRANIWVRLFVLSLLLAWGRGVSFFSAYRGDFAFFLVIHRVLLICTLMYAWELLTDSIPDKREVA